MNTLQLTTLDARDTPTTLTLSVGDDPLAWWRPDHLAIADSTAAEMSERIDVPGYAEWQVELRSVTHAPLIAQATGIDGWGVVWVGPAAAGYDLHTVMLHEYGHTLGIEHGTDPAGVMWPTIAAGEVRHWQPSDDALAAAVGLIVVVPADVLPPTDQQVPDEVYPYTEANPYRGPLVLVDIPGGWALVPPKVAEHWGLS